MEKTMTTIEIRKDLRERADQAVEKEVFTGISTLRGLIEYALEKLLNEKEGAVGSASTTKEDT